MSIKFIGILTLCVAVAVLSTSPIGGTTIRETHLDMDVAIVGNGCFRISDPQDFGAGECRYTRAGKLRISDIGLLQIEVDGKPWNIEPATTIPSYCD
ncbi:MAG: hypothetical protein AAGA30_10480, partial [Planctomycetota bacterium]